MEVRVLTCTRAEGPSKDGPMNMIKSIEEIRKSIVAVGYTINSNTINIIGSGFCIRDNHTIVTCAHVYNQIPKDAINHLKLFVMIEEKLDYLEKYSWLSAKIKYKNDDHDIAVLILEDRAQVTMLKPLALGDSDKATVGQDVYLLGFPYAAQLINDGFGLTSHVSKTIISNIKRDGIKPNHERNWIFFDTINNPGNSGCPLIDAETNLVIGVVSMALKIPSKIYKDLDIREPMHIGGAKPVNFVSDLLK
jgi:S1-C subfamily serine protease